MMVVTIETEPTFNPGNPEVLFEAAHYRFATVGRDRPWDVAGDGRFLMIKNAAQDDTVEAQPPQINVVLNWFEELQRLVPTP